VCCGVVKLMEMFGVHIFAYDLKILYELQGIKFESFDDLCKKVLGEESTHKLNFYSDKMRAHLESYRQTKIDIRELDILSVIPEDTICDFYSERSFLMQKLWDNIQDPDFFRFYESFYPAIMKPKLHKWFGLRIAREWIRN